MAAGPVNETFPSGWGASQVGPAYRARQPPLIRHERAEQEERAVARAADLGQGPIRHARDAIALEAIEVQVGKAVDDNEHADEPATDERHRQVGRGDVLDLDAEAQ